MSSLQVHEWAGVQPSSKKLKGGLAAIANLALQITALVSQLPAGTAPACES